MKWNEIGCFALLALGIVFLLIALGASVGLAKLGFDLVAGS